MNGLESEKNPASQIQWEWYQEPLLQTMTLVMLNILNAAVYTWRRGSECLCLPKVHESYSTISDFQAMETFKGDKINKVNPL